MIEPSGEKTGADKVFQAEYPPVHDASADHAATEALTNNGLHAHADQADAATVSPSPNHEVYAEQAPHTSPTFPGSEDADLFYGGTGKADIRFIGSKMSVNLEPFDQLVTSSDYQEIAPEPADLTSKLLANEVNLKPHIDILSTVTNKDTNFKDNTDEFESLQRYTAKLLLDYNATTSEIEMHEPPRQTSEYSPMTRLDSYILAKKLQNSSVHTADPKTETAGENSLPERKLRSSFDTMVAGIDLQDIMVPFSERPITRPEAYTLTTVVAPGAEQSLKSGGYRPPTDGRINCSYGVTGQPYLDTACAIGLVYYDQLIAVASAGVGNNDRLVIKQIQDVTGVRRSDGKQKYYATGLHNGIQWRDTLVSAWERVATEIGSPVIVVQSYRNNSWQAVRDRGRNSYDAVAERRGGYVQNINGDWEKRLAFQD